MNVDHIERLVESRHSVRSFLPDTIDAELMARLLRITQKAPSAYNIQPIEYYVVTARSVREALMRSCMGNQPALNAPAIVIFAGNTHAAQDHGDRVLEMDQAVKNMTDKQCQAHKLGMDFWFSRKPFGFGWIVKACIIPLLRWIMPIPEIATVHQRAWLAREGGLSAMTFMLAAQSAGLSTCSIGAFDGNKVKKAVGIPQDRYITLMVAVGYADQKGMPSSRLPLDEVVHRV